MEEKRIEANRNLKIYTLILVLAILKSPHTIQLPSIKEKSLSVRLKLLPTIMGAIRKMEKELVLKEMTEVCWRPC